MNTFALTKKKKTNKKITTNVGEIPWGDLKVLHQLPALLMNLTPFLPALKEQVRRVGNCEYKLGHNKADK